MGVNHVTGIHPFVFGAPDKIDQNSPEPICEDRTSGVNGTDFYRTYGAGIHKSWLDYCRYRVRNR